MTFGTYFYIVWKKPTFYIHTYMYVWLEREINTDVYYIYLTFFSESSYINVHIYGVGGKHANDKASGGK